MSIDDEHEGDIWERLRRIREVVCESCGYENTTGSRICTQCNAPLAAEEEERSFSAVAGEVRTGSDREGGKTHLGEAKTLTTLKNAVDGICSGLMSKEEYNSVIVKILNMAKTGISLFDTDTVRKKIETLPPAEVEVVNKTHEGFKKFYDGVWLMYGYSEVNDVNIAKDGYTMAEEAMSFLDTVQDKALEIVGSR